MEFYIISAVVSIIVFLWWRNKVLADKNDALEVRIFAADRLVNHHAAVAAAQRKREENKPAQIKEAVKNAVNSDFDDFYS